MISFFRSTGMAPTSYVGSADKLREVMQERARISSSVSTVMPRNPLEPSGLEEILNAHVLSKKPCDFFDFMKPNELNVATQLPQHLQKMDEGWIVSCGTERSLSDLLLAPEQCLGVIVIDINWKVKAYIDCIVLLLRLSNSFEEFQRFTTSGYTQEEIASKEKDIRPYLSRITDVVMRSYYETELRNLLDVFFINNWRSPQEDLYSFDDPSSFYELGELFLVDFTSHKSLFNKLKIFADSGRIIAIEGSINNLENIISRVKLSVVDASNISQYIPLDLQIPTGSSPTIICTTFKEKKFLEYFSCKYEPLSGEERKEFEKLYEIFHKTYLRRYRGRRKSFNALALLPHVPGGYDKKTFEALREYVKKNIFIRGEILINFQFLNEDEMFMAMEEFLRDPIAFKEFTNHEKFPVFFENLIDSMLEKDFKAWELLQQDFNWKAKFEESLRKKVQRTETFCKILEEKKFLEELKKAYGEDGFDSFLKRLKGSFESFSV